jgi:hypothetical protein
MASKLLRILALCLCLARSELALNAQAELPRAPISALWSDGTRLLIGQGGTLSEVTPIDERLLIRWQVGLGRGALQAVAVCAPFIFVLSADGLSALDAEQRERAFVRGGGHRLACNADQVWIAALGAGVRRYQVTADGRLSALPSIQTVAQDVTASGADAFWVAEGELGVRRYALNGEVQLWLNAFTPAQIVRERDGKLFIGYGAQLSIVSLGALPQAIGAASLIPADAELADLLIVGDRIYAGRQHSSGRGASLIVFELSAANALRLIAQFGEDGNGARLGALGAELFIVGGSTFTWLRFDQATPRAVMTWSAVLSQCAPNAPTDPQPSDGAQVRDGRLRLEWRASCADSFELWLDGALLATVLPSTDAESERPSHGYAVALDEGVHRWQVIALGANGARAASPTWRVYVASDGLLGTPSAPSGSLLYQPPFAARTLIEAILMLSAAACGGLLIVIAAAWWLGKRAQQRLR